MKQQKTSIHRLKAAGHFKTQALGCFEKESIGLGLLL
jgi:hypothetical protein